MLAPIILNIADIILSIFSFSFWTDIIFLDESVIMDGASYPRVYFSIILPNLKPAIATVLIIKFVGIYNDFYTQSFICLMMTTLLSQLCLQSYECHFCTVR